MAVRDYPLNTTVPAPGVPIGYVTVRGGVFEVMASEEWRRGWFENVGSALFGPTGENDVTADIPTGSYVGSVSIVPARGISVSGTPAPGYTVTLDLAQDIRPSATVTFQNITCPGQVDGRDVSNDGAKLDTIQTGATANATNAQLRDRATHTGTQAWGTISGTPTTIAGYGITNAYTKSEVDAAVGGKVTKTTISAITTDMSSDAFSDELKTKINAIIAALNA